MIEPVYFPNHDPHESVVLGILVCPGRISRGTLKHLHAARDGREGITNLVRHPGSHLADSRKSLGLPEVLLHGHHIRHVLKDHHTPNLATVRIDQTRSGHAQEKVVIALVAIRQSVAAHGFDQTSLATALSHDRRGARNQFIQRATHSIRDTKSRNAFRLGIEGSHLPQLVRCQ